MSSYQADIRTGIYNAILTAMPNYVHPEAKVEETYYPHSNLEDITDRPEIKVTATGMGSERNREYRSAGIKKLTLGVIIHIQQRVNPEDNAQIDILIELLEQVMNTCEDDDLVTGEKYTWDSTEPLKDDNDLIFSYEALTIGGIFQAVFTAHYTHILE